MWLSNRHTSFPWRWNDGLRGAVADDEVAEVLLVSISDQPNGTGARLLALLGVGNDKSVGLGWAVGRHPAEFDGLLALIDEDDVEGVAVGLGGWRGVAWTPLQCGQRYDWHGGHGNCILWS